MRVLILEDDANRSPILINFWQTVAKKQEEGDFNYVWLYESKHLIDTLISYPEITYISLDHDLGTSDVSRDIINWQMNDTDRFNLAFKDRHVIIHSMNPPASMNMMNRLAGCCASVQIVPFSQMRAYNG
jgi:hypothetical protein